MTAGMIKTSTMNVAETKKLIGIIRAAECKVVPLLVGNTGTGKTEVIRQIARSLNQDLIIIHVAQIEPSDFSGLFKITEDERTKTCPPEWLPYKDWEEFREKYKNVHGVTLDHCPYGKGVVNPNGGIIFLDEVNRGNVDIRQTLYQLLNDKQIREYRLPKGYDLIAAANPPGYEVYEFDQALNNRFAWICFVPDHKETQDHLLQKYGESPIISWLNSDPNLVDYGEEFEIPLLALSPRIEENSIKMYPLLEKERKGFMIKALQTIVTPEKVKSFMMFLEETKNINYKDILKGGTKDKVAELLKENKIDILSHLTIELSRYLNDPKNNDVKAAAKKNIADFLASVPPELSMAFMNNFTDEYYDSKHCIILDKYFIDTVGKETLVRFEKHLS